MNKMELITSMAQKSGLTKKDCETALNAWIASVEDAMKNREDVALIGFGKFEVKKRAARKGRNPQTKKEIVIPETYVPVFKAGKGLKELVKKK